MAVERGLSVRAQTCRRCGSCCRSGGPALHHEDRHLIERGTIPAGFLVTIRKGEQVHENVKDCLGPSTSEIIKIRGQNGRWTCAFYNETDGACGIYAHRPLECRVLKCWDPLEMINRYEETRLARKDLLAHVKGLWELVVEHEKHCNYDRIRRLLAELDGAQRLQAREDLAEIERYDAHFRKLVLQKSGLDAQMLDFLFGRALVRTMPGLTAR